MPFSFSAGYSGLRESNGCLGKVFAAFAGCDVERQRSRLGRRLRIFSRRYGNEFSFDLPDGELSGPITRDRGKYLVFSEVVRHEVDRFGLTCGNKRCCLVCRNVGSFGSRADLRRYDVEISATTDTCKPSLDNNLATIQGCKAQCFCIRIVKRALVVGLEREDNIVVEPRNFKVPVNFT